jgi:hypothetical protein
LVWVFKDPVLNEDIPRGHESHCISRSPIFFVEASIREEHDFCLDVSATMKNSYCNEADYNKGSTKTLDDNPRYVLNFDLTCEKPRFDDEFNHANNRICRE